MRLARVVTLGSLTRTEGLARHLNRGPLHDPTSPGGAGRQPCVVAVMVDLSYGRSDPSKGQRQGTPLTTRHRTAGWLTGWTHRDSLGRKTAAPDRDIQHLTHPREGTGTQHLTGSFGSPASDMFRGPTPHLVSGSESVLLVRHTSALARHEASGHHASRKHGLHGKC